MKLNSATATIAGLASGMITRQRTCRCPPPSTRMASVSSLGIVRKNCRSRKIEKASPKKLGMIRGLSVPMNWIPVHSWNCLAHRM
jgi:hypothetical protein